MMMIMMDVHTCERNIKYTNTMQKMMFVLFFNFINKKKYKTNNDGYYLGL